MANHCSPRIVHNGLPLWWDGGDTYVDPTNGDRAIVEYVGLDMALTKTVAARTEAPVELVPRDLAGVRRLHVHAEPCDPTPVHCPFEDPLEHLALVRRRRVPWDNHTGVGHNCSSASCDWTYRRAQGGALHEIGVASERLVRGVVRAVQLGRLPRGILTNAGGTVHQLNLPVPRDRAACQPFIQGVFVDPANASHVYVVFNGSRRGRTTMDSVEGHVFETMDAGATGPTSAATCRNIPATTSSSSTTTSCWQPTSASWSRPARWNVVPTGIGSAQRVGERHPAQLGGTRVIAATHGVACGQSRHLHNRLVVDCGPHPRGGRGL
jgi:hypothetical protein